MRINPPVLVSLAVCAALVASGVLVFLAWEAQRPPAEWVRAQELHTVEGYRAFLTTDPDEILAEAAQRRIVELRWEEVEAAHTAEAALQFIDEYPDHFRARSARRLIRMLEFEEQDLALEEAASAGDRAALEAFISRYPDGELAPQARMLIALQNLTAAIAEASEFLERVPNDMPDPRVCDRLAVDPSVEDRWEGLRASARSIEARLDGAWTFGRDASSAAYAALRNSGHRMELSRAAQQVVEERRELQARRDELAADLRALLRRPVIQGGLGSRHPQLMVLAQLLEEEPRAAVRADIVGEIECAIESSVNRNELTSYLETYPDSESAPLARDALERLDGRSFYELLEDGLISATVVPVENRSRGRGIEIVSGTDIEIVNHTDTPLSVILPAGMVVRHGLIASDRRTPPILPGETQTAGDVGVISVGFALDLIEAFEDVNGALGVSRLSDEHPLTGLIGNLRGVGGLAGWQAVVWIVVEDRTYDEMSALRTISEDAFIGSQGTRAIDEDVTERVLEALAEAGVDVSSYRICEDGRWSACGR